MRQLSLFRFQWMYRRVFVIWMILATLPKGLNAEPGFVLNGGYGWIRNAPNTIEFSGWFHVSFLDRLYNLWYGQSAWFGLSQGFFPNANGKWGYFEAQAKLYDIDAFPIGISYGPLFLRSGNYGWRGSVWVNCGFLALEAGYEARESSSPKDLFVGLLLKYPLCLYGCNLWEIPPR